MIIGLFRQICERGVSLCFISHNLDLVSEFCDRIVVMYGGRVAEVGTASEIAGQSRHPYTKALLSAIPIPDPDAPRQRIVLDPAAVNRSAALREVSEGHFAAI